MSKEQKKLIRNSILVKRNSMTSDEIREAEKLILDNLMMLEDFTKAENVFCFLSFRSEVPTKVIIDYCKQQGKNVYIPACIDETKEMIISKYDEEVKLAPSKYGVMEPTPDTIKISDRNILDIAIMPGAAFDKRGYRIGYGAGYYDKFYAHAEKNISKIALAYSFQIIDEVPENEFDIPVDYIITEKDTITCARE